MFHVFSKGSVRLFVVFLAFLMVGLLVAGCESPLGPDDSDDPNDSDEEVEDERPYGISGTVVSSVGGAAVEGATVSLESSDGDFSAETTSDGDGYFEFLEDEYSELEAGTYDITGTAEERAASRLQSVALGDERLNVEVVQPYDARPDLPESPPELDSSSIEAGQTVEDTINLKFEVTDAENAIVPGSTWPAMSLWVGSEPSESAVADATSGGSSLEYAWDTSDNSGETALTVVAYDVKNNRTQWSIPVSVEGEGGSPPDSTVSRTSPNDAAIEAVTFGESLELFSLDAVGAMASGDDSTIRVDIAVEPASDATGVQVFRSTSGSDGPYSQVAEVSSIEDGKHRYADTSTELSPGTSAYYRFAYYNEGGSGDRSDPFEVPLLGEMRVNLETPGDGEAAVSLTPTLEWTVETESSGATLVQEVEIVDTDFNPVLDKDEGEGDLPINSDSSFEVPDDVLEPGRQYEWSVFSLLATTRHDEAVVSVSLPSRGGVMEPGLANNGFFRFATETSE